MTFEWYMYIDSLLGLHYRTAAIYCDSDTEQRTMRKMTIYSPLMVFGPSPVLDEDLRHSVLGRM